MKIVDLSVKVQEEHVLTALCLDLAPGTLCALMGPNGSGKSSLAKTIMGHPDYEITGGSISCNGQDLGDLAVHERSRLGIFLSFQQPIVLPGVGVVDFLKEMYDAHGAPKIEMAAFVAQIGQLFKFVGLDQSFLYRNMHEGFSGGEQKRLEVVQLLLLKPKVIVLDEIDSGLDVDALQAISKALCWHKQQYPQTIWIVITHYARILKYLVPEKVVVLVEGKVVATGGASLAEKIDKDGYQAWVKE